jgi:hypothetical protein
MALKLEVPEGQDALSEFVLFHDRVYQYRSASWPAILPLQLPILNGKGPFASGRRIRPFLVRDGAEISARAVAVIDQHYNHHWNERLGHIIMFEAMPDSLAATRMAMDAACEWLQKQGTEAARAGFGLLEFPFAIDDYESLPPNVVRHNPPYYHSLLKDSGFETEKGWVDYKIEVRPELIARYQSALEAARRAGFNIVPLKDVAEQKRVPDFTDTWNDAFKLHWGATPFSAEEFTALFQLFAMTGALETSVLAFKGDSPVGALLVDPYAPDIATLKPGRALKDSEKLNFLGIGVRESARGRGVNLAMAAYAFLKLIDRGAKFLSYTLVLDDNWPSRRTAEKLGAHVCANYMVYRRNFRR